MDVLLVHKTKIGGVAVHVKYLKKYLERKGFEVKEITRNEDLKMDSLVKSYQRMKDLFKRWEKDYDVIHAHDWSIALPAVRAGIKNLVVTLHGLPTNFVAKYFNDYIVKKLKNRVIVVSPYMLKRYPYATYIPNGVDLEVFKKYNIGNRTNRNVMILGVAQEYNKSKIIAIAKKIGFSIKIAKGIKNEEMPMFYNQLDIFVSIPPKTTGFNLVWLEAMACEVPYIIGTNDGIGELLPIYKIKTFKDLEMLLRSIKEKKIPPLRLTREWIKANKFTWDTHVEKLIELYKEIV